MINKCRKNIHVIYNENETKYEIHHQLKYKIGTYIK